MNNFIYKIIIIRWMFLKIVLNMLVLKEMLQFMVTKKTRREKKSDRI